MSAPIGDGPGAITEDGSAVEVYARLPAGEDPALVHTHLPAGASVLDLGAGTGRLADPLAALGHRVVAVDSSADMLARVRRASPITSRIQDLHLSERFDSVLLPSHLINTPDADARHQLLAAVARHLRPGGTALVQWHPPTWFDAQSPVRTSTGTIGDLRTTFCVHSLEQGLLTATVTYEVPAQVQGGAPARWTHRFTARRLDFPQLRAEAARVGLDLTGTLPQAENWLTATTVGAASAPPTAAPST